MLLHLCYVQFLSFSSFIVKSKRNPDDHFRCHCLMKCIGCTAVCDVFNAECFHDIVILS